MRFFGLTERDETRGGEEIEPEIRKICSKQKFHFLINLIHFVGHVQRSVYLLPEEAIVLYQEGGNVRRKEVEQMNELFLELLKSQEDAPVIVALLVGAVFGAWLTRKAWKAR